MIGYDEECPEWTAQTVRDWFTIEGIEYQVEMEISWRWRNEDLETQLDIWTATPEPPAHLEDKLTELIHDYLTDWTP